MRQVRLGHVPLACASNPSPSQPSISARTGQIKCAVRTVRRHQVIVAVEIGSDGPKSSICSDHLTPTRFSPLDRQWTALIQWAVRTTTVSSESQPLTRDRTAPVNWAVRTTTGPVRSESSAGNRVVQVARYRFNVFWPPHHSRSNRIGRLLFLEAAVCAAWCGGLWGPRVSCTF